MAQTIPDRRPPCQSVQARAQRRGAAQGSPLFSRSRWRLPRSSSALFLVGLGAPKPRCLQHRPLIGIERSDEPPHIAGRRFLPRQQRLDLRKAQLHLGPPGDLEELTELLLPVAVHLWRTPFLSPELASARITIGCSPRVDHPNRWGSSSPAMGESSKRRASALRAWMFPSRGSRSSRRGAASASRSAHAPAVRSRRASP